MPHTTAALHNGSCTATVTYEEPENFRKPDGSGLIALQNGEKHCLCLLYDPSENDTDNTWMLLPTSEEALPDGCSPVISIADASGMGRLYYSVSFTAADGCKVELFFTPSVIGDSAYPTLMLNQCILTKPDQTVLKTSHNGMDEVHFSLSITGDQVRQTKIKALIPFDINHHPTETLLYAMTDPDAAIGYEPPPNAAFVSCVHRGRYLWLCKDKSAGHRQ